MIIGNGDIATAIRESGIDQGHIIYFASGVSNSKETRQSEFSREIDLLRQQSQHMHLVYFSTLSIYYMERPDNLYVPHKRIMEALVKNRFPFHTIIRIGNITWGNNPNTLINYFKANLHNKNSRDILPVYRHLLDKEEFIYWLKLILVGTKNEMNITGKLTWVPKLFNDIRYGDY